MDHRCLYAAVLLLLFLGVGLLGWSNRAAPEQVRTPSPAPPASGSAVPPAPLPDLDAMAQPLPMPHGQNSEAQQASATPEQPIDEAVQVAGWIKRDKRQPPDPSPPPPDPPEPTPPATDNVPAPPGAADAARPPAPVNPGPGLHLEKIGPPSVALGKPFTYELVLRNPSSAPLYQVRIEDEVPPGSNFLGANPRPEVQGGRLIWNIGTLNAGAEIRIKVELQPIRDGDIQTQAMASFSTTSDLRTRVTQARLAVTKTGPETAQVGDEMTFEIRVTNTGSGPATHVLIHDDLPAGVQHRAEQEHRGRSLKHSLKGRPRRFL